ncbi:hypothetical protein B0H11DRAFT_1995304 [Mycena galericulata]|nr:hypothetical protein B0H11DRAFT_1995304 [Mycena galericulata]
MPLSLPASAYAYAHSPSSRFVSLCSRRPVSIYLSISSLVVLFLFTFVAGYFLLHFPNTHIRTPIFNFISFIMMPFFISLSLRTEAHRSSITIILIHAFPASRLLFPFFVRPRPFWHDTPRIIPSISRDLAIPPPRPRH